MSSRALRKAQREREEQDRLQNLQQQQVEEDEDEDDAPPQAVKKSAFAMLGEEEDDEDEDGGAALDNEEKDEPSEKPSQAALPKPSAKKKKKKNKGKGGGTPAQNMPEKDELDEIDKALRQLAMSGNAGQAGSTAAGVSAYVDETSRLLAIDTSHLHAQNEMRRLFGRAALEQQEGDEPAPNAHAGGNRRQQRQAQQGGLAQALRGQGAAGGRSGGLAAMALRRNIFIQGKEEWPIATGGGLGMEVEEKRADGTVLYRFVHNSTYQGVQAQFETCVESMDPSRLIMLLQHNPYHISTLLQVSEIAKQERDHATSGDLLERALFSFGRAVHSTFSKNLSEGKARLDFARPENREFWLASWRYMQNLSMRATWRTVYEWAKLLLSLSPQDDPYALWLVLDQYALRSRQDLDYLNISRNPTFKAVHHDMPNIQLSQGLAEFRAGNKSKGRQALFTAIGRFPWAVARLMQELAIDPPPAIWGKEPRTEKEKLYSELYATRAKDLWNTPETSALLTEVASALPPDTPSAEPNSENISLNEARHVLLSDTPALIALLPRDFTTRLTSASDPLPPDNSLSSYLADRTRIHTAFAAPGTARAGVQAGGHNDEIRELQGLYSFFSNLFPWFNPSANNEDGAAGVDDAGAAAAGVDAGAVGGTARATPEEMERRIRESGVSEEVIVERTQRMMQLQQRLMGDFGGEDEELAAFGPGLRNANGVAEEDDVEGAGTEERRARVEEDEDDDDD
ncbi:hypothetical protein LTR36_005236 [Oleoguttula mirabilis]|uniref:DUF654-domain-containing protein n=1 Tax=Oleoguttula mirabilis TaxID=1507867 RepID=A0AAV9JWG3_9PEZI|nr:hypothetical protein LTR36_005236 [Oleoguttula mirabilis]